MTEQNKYRGFASMDPEKQRAIASMGGRRAHEIGTAHEFDSDEARAAGSKGGRSVSANVEHMREIGRRGGLKRHGYTQIANTNCLSAPTDTTAR